MSTQGPLRVGHGDRSGRVGGVCDQRRHFYHGGSATVGWNPRRASLPGTGRVKGQHAMSLEWEVGGGVWL